MSDHAIAADRGQDLKYVRAEWWLPAIEFDGRLAIKLTDAISPISVCAWDMPATLLPVRDIVERCDAATAMFRSTCSTGVPLPAADAQGRITMFGLLTEWPTASDVVVLEALNVRFLHCGHALVPDPGSADWIAYSLPGRLPTAPVVMASIRAYELVRQRTSSLSHSAEASAVDCVPAADLSTCVQVSAVGEPCTHRDCDEDPGDIATIARVHEILKHHPPRERLCPQDIAAFKAVGGCV